MAVDRGPLAEETVVLGFRVFVHVFVPVSTSLVFMGGAPLCPVMEGLSPAFLPHQPLGVCGAGDGVPVTAGT